MDEFNEWYKLFHSLFERRRIVFCFLFFVAHFRLFLLFHVLFHSNNSNVCANYAIFFFIFFSARNVQRILLSAWILYNYTVVTLTPGIKYHLSDSPQISLIYLRYWFIIVINFDYLIFLTWKMHHFVQHKTVDFFFNFPS